MSVMAPDRLAETNLAIEELAEEIERENARRYAFYRMLDATDRVLGRLEELNLAGEKVIPGEMRAQIRAALAGLPTVCLAALKDDDRTQTVLDSVFDVQERLLRWHDPDRATDDDEEVEPPDEDGEMAEEIIDHLLGASGGLTPSKLGRRFPLEKAAAAIRLLYVLEQAGRVHSVERRARRCKPSRRYFAGPAA